MRTTNQSRPLWLKSVSTTASSNTVRWIAADAINLGNVPAAVESLRTRSALTFVHPASWYDIENGLRPGSKNH